MATPTWKGPTDQLVEANNSPSYQVGERIIKVRTYHGLFSHCESVLPDFSRGTAGSGDEDGYVVGAATLNKIRGGSGQLAVQWEASASTSGYVLPPDEVSVSPDNINPRLETHPRFATLDQEDLANVESALRAQDETARSDAYAALDTLGQELVDRIRRGNESYYLAALRYSWVTHSWTLPTMTRGGFVQSPSGPLSGYFSGTLSWLRESDDLQLSGGIWRYTRNWLGAADGRFDTDLDT